MADEKLNPSQGEQIKLDISGSPPAPDLTGEGPPAPEPGSPAEPGPGDVVVDVGKIDELMAKRQAAAREAVEQQADIVHFPTVLCAALNASGGVKVPLYQSGLEVPGEAKLVKVFRDNEVSLICLISPRRQLRQNFAGVDQAAL